MSNSMKSSWGEASWRPFRAPLSLGPVSRGCARFTRLPPAILLARLRRARQQFRSVCAGCASRIRPAHLLPSPLRVRMSHQARQSNLRFPTSNLQCRTFHFQILVPAPSLTTKCPDAISALTDADTFARLTPSAPGWPSLSTTHLGSAATVSRLFPCDCARWNLHGRTPSDIGRSPQ